MTTQHPKAALIGALLRKAERASTPEEAEAYMAKAQALSTEYQVDLELARLAHAGRNSAPVPTCKIIEIGTAGKRGLFTYVQLFSQIAHVNNVKCDVMQNSTRIWAYGFDTDIEMVQELYNSLIVQMVAASDAFVRAGSWRGEIVKVVRKVRRHDGWEYYRTREVDYKQVTATSARISFQEAFAIRIGQRLREAKDAALYSMDRQARADGLSTGAELVLVGREEAVAVFYKGKSDAKGSYKGGKGARARSTDAAHAGREAANRARLGKDTAIGGRRTAISA